jgi:glycine/D-amino acid oxidase-like deaminating enzyme
VWAGAFVRVRLAGGRVKRHHRDMTDVVVIGGGIVGCAVAAHLADAGRTVVLIEQTAIAAGASGRNSGVIQHPFDPVLVDLYRETLARYRALPTAVDAGLALADAPAGLLMVAHDADVLRAQAAALARTHPELRPEFLGPGEATALEPALGADVAAVRLGIGYPVAPDVATTAYAAWARTLGVEVRIGLGARPWLGPSGVSRGVVLEDGQRIGAPDVVVAAGPWSPALIDPDGTWRPIRALWGVVVSVEVADPPSHVIEEAEADLEPGTTDEPATHAFSLVTAAGRSSMGSTFLATEPDATAELPRILARARTFVPGLERARLGEVRACARPLSLDGRPLIGRVPGVDGLWVAAGHGPWGISTGPAAGPMLVRAMDGDRDAIPVALDPGRFGPVPPPSAG